MYNIEKIGLFIKSRGKITKLSSDFWIKQNVSSYTSDQTYILTMKSSILIKKYNIYINIKICITFFCLSNLKCKEDVSFIIHIYLYIEVLLLG